MNQSNGVKEMMSEYGYSDRAIQYYIERPHIGTFTDADQISEMTGTCGDTMEIYLKVDDDKIVGAKYQVMGCAAAIAAAMAVVDLIKGKSINEAKKVVDGDVFRMLEEIPVKKHHCIQLAVKTLHKGLDDYRHNNQPST